MSEIYYQIYRKTRSHQFSNKLEKLGELNCQIYIKKLEMLFTDVICKLQKEIEDFCYCIYGKLGNFSSEIYNKNPGSYFSNLRGKKSEIYYQIFRKKNSEASILK